MAKGRGCIRPLPCAITVVRFRKRRRFLLVKATKKWWPIFVLPTFLAFIIGFIVPFLEGLYLSFCKFTTINKAAWVGIGNYVKVFEDAQFWTSLGFTASFTVVSTILINVLAFAVALALTKGIKGTNVFRTVYFMPNLIGGIVLGYIWNILINCVLSIAGQPLLALNNKAGYWGMIILMLVGPANSSNVNDNTSGVVSVLEIAKSLPENYRKDVCFVLFDLEEAGLIGSASYQKAHKKATASQLVLNLDCVGDGDNLMLFPTKKLRKDRKRLTSLYKACGYFGKKSILLHEKGFAFYPSDQANFPYGVGVCALRKRKKTLYLSRIHTKKDTILEYTNVNLLSAALITYLCRDAAQ